MAPPGSAGMGVETTLMPEDSTARPEEGAASLDVRSVHTVPDDLEVDPRNTGVIADAKLAEVFQTVYAGDYLISCELDGSIGVRDADSGKLIMDRARPHPDAHVTGVFQIAARDSLLYSVCWDGIIRCWRLPSLQVLHAETTAHRKRYATARYGGFSIALSSDGLLLATGGGDGDRTIQLWDTSPAGPIKRRKMVEKAHDVVQHLVFAPQGDILVSVGSEATLRVWSVPGLEPVDTVVRASNKHAEFSPDGHTLASCGSDQAIKLWTVPSLELKVVRPDAHTNEIRRLAYSPDGATIASCSLDSSVRLWSSSSLSPIAALHAAHKGIIFNVAFCPRDGGRTLTTCGADRRIKRWYVPALAMSAGDLKDAGLKKCVSIGFGNEGSAVVHVAGDSSISIFHFPSFEHAVALAGQHESQAAAVSPDGRLVAAMIGRNGVLKFFQVSYSTPWTVKPLFEFQVHDATSYAVAFSSDSAQVATGSEDGSIRLWHLEGRSKLAFVADRPDAHDTQYVNGVAFHPNGRMLASMSVRGGLRLWSVPDLEQLVDLRKAHPRDSNSHLQAGLCFNPSGDQLTSTGDSLRVWRVLLGAMELETEMHLSSRACVAYSASGDRVLLGRVDGRVQAYWTSHLPEADTSLFARGLDALRQGVDSETSLLPSDCLGVRDARADTYGWSLLHHACKLNQVGSVADILELSPTVLLDAVAPPFDGVIRTSRGDLVAAGPPARRDGAQLPAGELVPSVLEVALDVDAKACIGALLTGLTRLLKEQPTTSSGMPRRRPPLM